MDVFVKSLILGIALAAPIGPVGLICMRRSLLYGWLAGFFSGLGIATADAFFGILAVVGMGAISRFMIHFETPLRFIGIAFVFFIAFSIMFSRKTHEEKQVTEGKGLFGCFVSTFLLMITNPSMIAAFVLIFVALGLDKHSGHIYTSLTVLGVFIGSAVWWLFLSLFLEKIKGKITGKTMLWFNRISGFLILVLGVLSLLAIDIK